MRNRQQTDEADHGEAVGEDDEWPSNTVVIGHSSGYESGDGCEHVNWHDQELCVGCSVAEIGHDLGGSERKGIRGHTIDELVS